MMVRKQIIVSPDIDRRIRRLARQKGVSQSALIAEAVAALPDLADQVEQVLAFAGVIEDAPFDLSERVNELLYG